MKLLNLSPSAKNVCVAVVILAGCSGSQAQIGSPSLRQYAAQSGLNAWPPLFRRDIAMAMHTGGARSWMDPEAKKQNLLYVSSYGNNGEDVYVYSYPGGKLEGTLTGFALPAGECVDKSGNVFITNYDGADIAEYAHGGTQPIAVLQDQPYSNPLDCSIDPTTGNLAVSNAFGSSDHGNIAIYQNAQGTPQIFSDPNLFEFFACGYDDVGNLFVDAYNNRLTFAFAELPKDSSAFTAITVPKIPEKYGLVGGIQWDGKYVAIGNVDDDVVYQLQVSGAKAKVVGSTPLTDGAHVDFFSISDVGSGKEARQSARLVGSNYDGTGAKIWRYPAGGLSIKAIGSIDKSVGTAVSLAAK